MAAGAGLLGWSIAYLVAFPTGIGFSPGSVPGAQLLSMQLIAATTAEFGPLFTWEVGTLGAICGAVAVCAGTWIVGTTTKIPVLNSCALRARKYASHSICAIGYCVMASPYLVGLWLIAWGRLIDHRTEVGTPAMNATAMAIDLYKSTEFQAAQMALTAAGACIIVAALLRGQFLRPSNETLHGGA
jgi:hypothetical protein